MIRRNVKSPLAKDLGLGVLLAGVFAFWGCSPVLRLPHDELI
jgi:hypothetical protein